MRTCEVCPTEFYAGPNSTQRYCSKGCHDTGQRVESVRLVCEGCGGEFLRKPSQVAARFCSRACYSLGQFKNAIDREHNGKPVRVSDGYLLVWEPGHPHGYKGWVAEHRHVAEVEVGRLLDTAEQVHHLNGNKQDNRSENLAILDASAHTYVTLREAGMRRRAAQARIVELEARLAAYGARYGPLEGGGP